MIIYVSHNILLYSSYKMITCASLKNHIFIFLDLRAMEAILVNEWSNTSERSE